MSTTKMLKGIIDGCVLAIIKDKEVYGYELAEKLESYGFHSFSEGTIYPITYANVKEKNWFRPLFSISLLFTIALSLWGNMDNHRYASFTYNTKIFTQFYYFENPAVIKYRYSLRGYCSILINRISERKSMNITVRKPDTIPIPGSFSYSK